MSDTIQVDVTPNGEWQEVADGPGFFTSTHTVEFVESASVPDATLIGHRTSLPVNFTGKLWVRTEREGVAVIVTGG